MKRLQMLAAALCLTAYFVPAQAAMEVRPFVRGSYQEIVAARQGKPFILSFWSVSCGHCKGELAMLGDLKKKYPGLDVVLVSTDTPEETQSISSTLARFSLSRAEAWVFADSFTDRLRFEVDRKWHGELPRAYFFTVNHEVKAVSGGLERREVERWIKEQYPR